MRVESGARKGEGEGARRARRRGPEQPCRLRRSLARRFSQFGFVRRRGCLAYARARPSSRVSVHSRCVYSLSSLRSRDHPRAFPSVRFVPSRDNLRIVLVHLRCASIRSRRFIRSFSVPRTRGRGRRGTACSRNRVAEECVPRRYYRSAVSFLSDNSNGG